jgi:AcrR family transcriptional regulator
MGRETTNEPTVDRRVRRSRAALMRAAIDLVSERGTTAVPVAEIADAADVSRQVLYQHFGDRDALLLAAALDLVERELLPTIADESTGANSRDRVLLLARHFAAHQDFYRAMLTGPNAYALNRELAERFTVINRISVRRRFGDDLADETAGDLASFITGGAAVFVNTWVVETDGPLDPEAFADRFLRAMSALATIDPEE